MEYENQIVILGFILALTAVAGNQMCLSINERKKERNISVWKTEIQWFLFGSMFIGVLLIFFGTMSLVFAIGAAVQGYWAELGESAFSFVIIVLVIWGAYCLYLLIYHPSVSMGKYADRKEMLKSIKKDSFTKLFNNCYISKHWIVLGEYFIPKTCLIGIDSYYVRGYYGSHSGHYHIKIYTIDGKEIYLKMAIICPDKNIDEIIDSIRSYATTNHFFTDNNLPSTGLRSINYDLEGLFIDYLEEHNDLDLLNDTTFANEIIEKWQSVK